MIVGHPVYVTALVNLDGLTDAVAALDPAPRRWRWVSLSLCVIDAVWSIAGRYHALVVPTVGKVGAVFGLDELTVAATTVLPPDPIPLPVLVSRFPEENSLRAVTTGNRTSSRGGIYKADAALRYARILTGHGIDTLAHAQGLLGDPDRFTAVEQDLRGVPGDGAHAVRRNYLWMLVGADDLIKPDRMILRWFHQHNVPADPVTATELIGRITDRLNSRAQHDTTASPRRYTRWEIDHAIWQAGRRLTPAAASYTPNRADSYGVRGVAL
ncbi:hypothetical protein [Nocardia aurea]|uniref:Uncharacterized protein n=1 Tax=Nocardia aurea TaxID=2144174 RepID=A0ABV3FW47_9NOCA